MNFPSDPSSACRPKPSRKASATVWFPAVLVLILGYPIVGSIASVDAAPTRSTTIALTSDETRVVVVNREANSVSVIRVKNANGNDIAKKLAEVPVGLEPRCVAVHPTDKAAYVTNAISGTVSVVNLNQGRVVKELRVGTEPRGCALTADGSLLYVANHTEGTVSIIDTRHPLNPIAIPTPVRVGGKPTAIAITDKGTGNVADDTVFVTQIFAELNPEFKDPIFDGNGEARAISGSEASSTPSRPAMLTRRLPKSRSPHSPIPASPPIV
jgi:YVTN family beta-propeller protein